MSLSQGVHYWRFHCSTCLSYMQYVYITSQLCSIKGINISMYFRYIDYNLGVFFFRFWQISLRLKSSQKVTLGTPYHIQLVFVAMLSKTWWSRLKNKVKKRVIKWAWFHNRWVKKWHLYKNSQGTFEFRNTGTKNARRWIHFEIKTVAPHFGEVRNHNYLHWQESIIE